MDAELRRYNKALLIGATPRADEDGVVKNDCGGETCIITDVNNIINCAIKHKEVCITAKRLLFGNNRRVTGRRSAAIKITCDKLMIYHWKVLRDWRLYINYNTATIIEPINSKEMLIEVLDWLSSSMVLGKLSWDIDYNSDWFKEIDIVDMVRNTFDNKYSKYDVDTFRWYKDVQKYTGTIDSNTIIELFTYTQVLKMIQCTDKKLKGIVIDRVNEVNEVLYHNPNVGIATECALKQIGSLIDQLNIGVQLYKL